jgi:hypothetical protein
MTRCNTVFLKTKTMCHSPSFYHPIIDLMSIYMTPWRFIQLNNYWFTSHSRIFHLYGDVTPLPMKGCKIQAYARRWGPLNSKGSISCHTCCDSGPRFFRSHPKDCPTKPPLTTLKGMWRIYFNPDPNGFGLFQTANVDTCMFYISSNISLFMTLIFPSSFPD